MDVRNLPRATSLSGQEAAVIIQGDKVRLLDLDLMPGATPDDPTATVEAFEPTNKEGSTIARGMAVASHSSGTGVVLALATGQSKPCIGIAGESINNNVAGLVLTDGLISIGDWSAIAGTVTLTRGPYYLDPSTPGKLTSVAPTADGQIVQEVGYALSPSTLDISIERYILL